MKKFFAVFLSLCLFAAVPIVGKVHAGTSLFSQQYTDNISNDDWFMTRDISDAYAATGNITFPAQSNRSSRLINKTRLFNLAYLGYDLGIEFSAKLNITDLPEGKRFGFATGLAFPDEYIQTSNTSFFYLTRTGSKLYFGISSYGAQGAEEVIVLPTQTVASLSTQFDIAVSVNTSGDISARVDEMQVFEVQDKQIYFDGYFAIGQDAGCQAVLSSIEINACTYHTPENYNALETFDNGTFNANVWYSESAAVSEKTAFLAPVDGVLRFKNVASGFISTRTTYSNAELCFDICNLKTDTVFDENNNISESFSAGFSIIFGSNTFRKVDSAAMVDIQIKPMPVNFLYSQPHVLIEVYQNGTLMSTAESVDIAALWSDSNVLSFRAFINDGEFSLQTRKDIDIFYSDVITLEIPGMRAGYIQLAALGTDAFYANFDIDNLSISNFDYGGKASVAPYINNFWPDADYEYINSWDDNDLLEGLK